MDSKFDKIKGMLSDDTPIVPSSLEWEKMEADILQKMEELEPESSQASDSKKRRRKRGLLLFLLPFLFLAYFIATSNKIVPLESSSVEHIELENVGHPNEASTVQRELIGTENSSSFRSGEAIANPSLPSVPEPEMVPAAEALSTMSESSPNANFSMLEDAPLATKRQQQLPSPALEAQQIADLSPSDISTTALKTTGEQYTILTLAPRIYKLNSLERTKLAPMIGSQPEVVQRTNGPNRKTSPTLSIGGGVTAWNMGYGESNPERADLETNRLSYHAHFSYFHPLNNGFTLMLGLQFQRLEHRFDWNTTIDDYPITLTDTVVQVRVNTITGERTEIRGDVDLIVSATRDIQHYNSSLFLQIPVGVGKSWAINRWQGDLLLGGGIQLPLQHQGRTLYQGEIYDYDGRSAEILTNNIRFNAIINGRISYSISDRIGLSTGLQIQKSLTNWSPEESVRMRPLTLNWQFGLNYSW